MEPPAIVNDLASIVQTALAPVFLLAGTAGFVGVYEIRLGRVSERLNAIQEKGERGEMRRTQLDYLRRRPLALEIAVALGTFAAICTGWAILNLLAGALQFGFREENLFWFFGGRVRSRRQPELVGPGRLVLELVAGLDDDEGGRGDQVITRRQVGLIQGQVDDPAADIVYVGQPASSQPLLKARLLKSLPLSTCNVSGSPATGHGSMISRSRNQSDLSKTECSKHKRVESREGASIVRQNPVTIRLQTSIARVSQGLPIGRRVSSATTKVQAIREAMRRRRAGASGEGSRLSDAAFPPT